MDLEGKAAIVTGGGTGVGRATALALAERGCSVAINYSRSQAEAEQTASEIDDLGAPSLVAEADVADDAACRDFVEASAAVFGRLDVLVNNAGTTVFCDHADLDGVDADDFRRVYEVNAIGPFQMSRAAKPHLVADGGGEIVNVSSVAGIVATGSSIPYCMSKSALNIQTVALARSLGPEVRVNAIAPGFITSRWLQEGLGDEFYDAVKANYESTTPLRAVCDPEDIRDAILSVIEGSDMMTGQIQVVDGGATIRW